MENVKQVNLNSNPDADFPTRIKQFEAELANLQERYQIAMNVSIEFPIYRVLPDEVKLAVEVIKNHKFQLQRYYTDKKGENNADVS